MTGRFSLDQRDTASRVHFRTSSRISTGILSPARWMNIHLRVPRHSNPTALVMSYIDSNNCAK